MSGDPNVKVTVVLDAEGLQGAVQSGVRHIQLRNHIDLTTLSPLNGGTYSEEKILSWPTQDVETIRVRIAIRPEWPSAGSQLSFVCPHIRAAY
jgi:hypothetical protein